MGPDVRVMGARDGVGCSRGGCGADGIDLPTLAVRRMTFRFGVCGGNGCRTVVYGGYGGVRGFRVCVGTVVFKECSGVTGIG